jgi:hypothetical protein
MKYLVEREEEEESRWIGKKTIKGETNKQRVTRTSEFTRIRKKAQWLRMFSEAMERLHKRDEGFDNTATGTDQEASYVPVDN